MSKTVLVAGATSVLGQAFIEKYKDQYNIVSLSRVDIYWDALVHADVLLNCVGDVNLIGLRHTSEKEFDDMIEANIKVPFLLAQSFMNGSRDDGHIINIGSTRSISTAPNKAIYAATKAALRFMTQSIGIETNIKATLICPGNFAEAGTIEATVNAIHFCIQNPEVKEMIINGMV